MALLNLSYPVLIRGGRAGVHQHLDHVVVTAFGGDVQRGGVGDLVPGGDHHRLVELHQLLQDGDRSLDRGDMRASAAILRKERKTTVSSIYS